MTEDGGLDPWARWLLGGRDAGFDDRQRNCQAAFLERVRDRVLEGARMTSGDSVLDIGAGTGLVAVEVARRLGSAGEVVALDISYDALTHCRAGTSGLRCSVGDSAALPFADGSFDVAVTRSVLIYVPDKLAAAAEIRRVLRPGGRVSLFEPVNAAGRQLGMADDDDGVPESLRADLAWSRRHRPRPRRWALPHRAGRRPCRSQPHGRVRQRLPHGDGRLDVGPVSDARSAAWRRRGLRG